jgi:phosphatidate cytidylyltransferase
VNAGATGSGPGTERRWFGLPRSLALRIVSSFVIGPPILLAVLYGRPWIGLVLVLLAGLIAWEWTRLVLDRRSRIVPVAVVAPVAGVMGAGLVDFDLGFRLLAVLTLAVLALSFMFRVVRPVLLGLGPVSAAVPTLCFAWIHDTDPLGTETTLWMAASVVVTDVAAYAAGRSIGGPKLAPRISPGKTWAGLLGAVVASAVFGAVFGFCVTGVNPAVLPVAGAVLAVVAQGGDLCESALKRHCMVKDSSALIPGHGGILDRLDGQIAVAPVVAAVMLVHGGTVLLW